MTILKLCIDTFPCTSLFTQEGLFRDFYLSLLKNGLASNSELPKLIGMQAEFTLFCIAAMHSSRIFVKASADRGRVFGGVTPTGS